MPPKTFDAHSAHTDSAIRRFLLWWLKSPATAHVTVNLTVEWAAARAYLGQLSSPAEGEAKVTVQHLIAGAIGQVLKDYPLANARIIRDRIELQPHVGLAMPVNLIGQPGGATKELGVAVVTEVEEKSLRHLAAATSRSVRAERSGTSENPVVRQLMGLGDKLPRTVWYAGMELFDKAMKVPAFARRVYAQAPVTAGLTNPGATFSKVQGLHFRGGSFTLPHRMLHLGTLWAVSTVTDEVVAVDGRPAVREVLPVMFIFDHRLVDGVVASRMLMRLSQILLDPAAVFGPDGRVRPGAVDSSTVPPLRSVG